MIRHDKRWGLGYGLCAVLIAFAYAPAACSKGKKSEEKAPAATAPAHAGTDANAKPAKKPTNQKEAKRTLSQPTLPGAVRKALHSTMLDHGDDMESLLWAALMLDYDSLQYLSERLASGPNLSRPVEGTGDVLNNYLPASFFDLQERLDREANLLGAAAKRQDDAAIATHYARITETCVSCHAMYMRLPAPKNEPAPAAPAKKAPAKK